MQQLVLILHVIIAMGLIGLVLIQHGKGADIGAAFGSGASQTVFGSQGSGSFLMKLTGCLAAAFFATSIILSYMNSRAEHQVQGFQLPSSSIQQPASSKPDNVEKQSIPNK